MSTNRRVIVIDDDQIFLRAVRRAASRARLIDLAVAESGELALDIVAQQPVDLAIVDVFMPGISGIEVARRLHGLAPNATIMIATAYLDDRVTAAAAEVGAARTLEKPYDLPSLVESLARAAATTPAQLVESHLAVARNIAGRLARSYGRLLGPDEIEALAYFGLCEAAARYDQARAEPFVAFAERRIRGAVIDELRRIGSHTRKSHERLQLITETRQQIEGAGVAASDAEVATRLGMTADEVVKAQRPTRVVFAPLDGEVASADATPEAQAERSEELALLARARDTLSPLDAAIIEMHYERELSFAAIARELGISQAKLLQRHARAIDRLRLATQYKRHA